MQIYLDDGFEGGRTRFFVARHGAELGAVAPVRGEGVVFDHALWHDGEAVTRGIKHVLRTDVMYLRRGAPARTGGGTELARLEGHDGYVYALAPLVDGALASGSRDRTIRIWRRPRGGSDDAGGGWRCETVLSGHAASVHGLVEARGGEVWSGGRDRTVRAWTLATGASRTLATERGAVLCLARVGGLAGGGVRIGAGNADGSVALFDAGGARAGRLEGHAGWVWALSALGRGQLASGADDGTVRVWDVACSWSSASPGAACTRSRASRRATVAPAKRRLAAGCADGSVAILADVGLGGALAGEIGRPRSPDHNGRSSRSQAAGSSPRARTAPRVSSGLATAPPWPGSSTGISCAPSPGSTGTRSRRAPTTASYASFASRAAAYYASRHEVAVARLLNAAPRRHRRPPR